jgi:hypothetical protein
MVHIELEIWEDVFADFFSGVLQCSLELEECLVAGQLKMYLMMRPKCSADWSGTIIRQRRRRHRMTKTYEKALESSSAAFQVPPSSIERAWVNLPIFKRSSSNLVYFQALLLHSIYTLETHF